MESRCETIRRYSIGALATLVAILTRVEMTPWLGDRVPFGLCFMSTLLTAWIAGTGPALFATALSVLAAAHFIIPPSNSLWVYEPGDQFALLVYATVTLASILLFHRVGVGQRLAEHSAIENSRLNLTLQETDRKKDQFLALLAHELRNPLAPILSAIDMMDALEDPKAHSRAKKIVRRQVGHLVALVDDLLDVARYVQGKLELKKEPVDLRVAVETAIEMNLPRIQERSHQLSVELPDGSVWFPGDEARITQIIGNLIHNATKYTPPGGHIRIMMSILDGTASISVQDDGIGIPEDLREHIFELFTQVNSTRTRREGGLGIGLAIVKQLVEMSGGRISAESEGPGRGSTFRICLPGITVSDLESPQRRDDSSWGFQLLQPDEGAEARHGRILLVDDNQDSLMLLRMILDAAGYVTETAIDGFKAIETARHFQPEMILLDIGLPGMDGHEVARTLRRDPRFRETRIIALSGWGAEEDFEKSRRAGIDLHLVKPFLPRELLKIINENSGSAALVEKAI
ncbi:MAG: response regulator [Planctomycetaceae bacterium]|nr:response regulator [Planctomycetaceae bacterium]